MRFILFVIGLTLFMFSLKLGTEFKALVMMGGTPAPDQFPLAAFWVNDVMIHTIDMTAGSPSPAELAGNVSLSISVMRYLGLGLAVVALVMTFAGRPSPDATG